MSALIRYDAERHRDNRNYLFFLLSLTAIVLFPGVIAYILPEKVFPARWAFTIFYIFTVVTGVYIVTATRRQLIIGYIAGFMIIIISALNGNILLDSTLFNTLNFLASSIFLLFLLVHCLKEVVRPKAIDVQTIYASICGYIILGMVGGLTFDFVNVSLQGAYSQAIPDTDFFSFLYFSFVTLTTLGYGDISPVHPVPRTLAILFAVIGQLYLTVLIAMLIGKYLSAGKDA